MRCKTQLSLMSIEDGQARRKKRGTKPLLLPHKRIPHANQNNYRYTGYAKSPNTDRYVGCYIRGAGRGSSWAY